MFLDFFDFRTSSRIAYNEIKEAFDRQSLEILLRTEIGAEGQRLTDISPVSDAWPETVSKTLKTAEDEGWFDELISAARANRPDNRKFVKAIDLVIRQRAGLVDARKRKSYRLPITVLAIALLVIAGSIWTMVIFGMPAFVGLWGFFAAPSVFQRFFKSQTIRALDVSFELFLRSISGTITVGVLGVALVLVTLGFRVVQADPNLPDQDQIELSSPRISFLDPGESAYFVTNPFTPTTAVSSIEGYDARTSQIFPWRKNRLEMEKYRPTVFLAVLPSPQLMPLLNFSRWSVRVVVERDGEKIIDQVLEKYFGEPVLLGPQQSLRSNKHLQVNGVISQVSLDKLANIQRVAGVNDQHQAKVVYQGAEYFFTSMGNEISLNVGDQITVEFRNRRGGNNFDVHDLKFGIDQSSVRKFRILVKEVPRKQP